MEGITDADLKIIGLQLEPFKKKIAIEVEAK